MNRAKNTTVTILHENMTMDPKISRYVTRTVGALCRPWGENAKASVTLSRVDRPYGNKYEARVTVTVDGQKFEASDSTLNPLAALDIACRKLSRGRTAKNLEIGGRRRLRIRKTRV